MLWTPCNLLLQNDQKDQIEIKPNWSGVRWGDHLLAIIIFHPRRESTPDTSVMNEFLPRKSNPYVPVNTAHHYSNNYTTYHM